MQQRIGLNILGMIEVKWDGNEIKMMQTKSKIIKKEDFTPIRTWLKQEGKRIVLCHGVFDLLHYGHIEHLQDAKKQGDVLVVSVTASKYVNKGPGRPYFSDEQRMAFLASLEIVDYVLLSEAVTVHEIVGFVQPDVYAKGKEYAAAEDDLTGNIGSEQAEVEKYGGRIYFTDGEVYSSTKLLNNFFAALPENVYEMSYGLKRKYGGQAMDKLREMIDAFQSMKVLVVGDIIIDKYVFCKMQGLTVKDSVLSTLVDYEEHYAGGSLAVARHLANFASQVSLLSMMGGESDLLELVEKKLQGIDLKILQDSRFVTPVKKRYLRHNKQRQEYLKLFSANCLLKPEECKHFDYSKFHAKLRELLPGYDLVVVCDYGHGLLDDEGLRIIEANAKYLAVNCQANSANYGTNIITKYHRADMFSLDEREIRLAFGQALTKRTTLLKELMKKLNAQRAWCTIGADGAIGSTGEDKVYCPALLLKVKDTIGAGDAFYALASLCAATNMPMDLATLVANTAGAIKTNVVGNKESVRKVDLLKFLSTVLNV